MTKRALSDDAGRTPPAPLEISVAELAREVVGRVAPGQSEYLELVIAARERDAGRVRRPAGWTGGAVGSGGTGLDVVANVVIPLLTGTVTQVWGAAAFAGLQRRRWWRRAPRPVPSTRVVLAADRIDEAHTACVKHGMTLGLSEAEAVLLADAVEGVLRRGAAGRDA